jgi:hypothetical protein
MMFGSLSLLGLAAIFSLNSHLCIAISPFQANLSSFLVLPHGLWIGV